MQTHRLGRFVGSASICPSTTTNDPRSPTTTCRPPPTLQLTPHTTTTNRSPHLTPPPPHATSPAPLSATGPVKQTSYLPFFCFFLSRFHECTYKQLYVRSAHYHVPAATSHLTHVPTATSCQLRPPTAPHTRRATEPGKQKKKGSLGYPFLCEVCFSPIARFYPPKTRTRSHTCVRLTFLFIFIFFLSRFHQRAFSPLPRAGHLPPHTCPNRHQLPTQTTNRTSHQTRNRAGKTKKRGSLGYPCLVEVCFSPIARFYPPNARTRSRTCVRLIIIFIFIAF